MFTDIEASQRTTYYGGNFDAEADFVDNFLYDDAAIRSGCSPFARY